jgi:hypothetical protein
MFKEVKKIMCKKPKKTYENDVSPTRIDNKEKLEKGNRNSRHKKHNITKIKCSSQGLNGIFL